jgi:hypothetical protein
MIGMRIILYMFMIFTIVSAIAFFGLGFILPDSDCKSMYSDIEADLEKANFCENDSDCAVLMLGGEYIEFGCYHFINKDVYKEPFYEKMEKYRSECSTMIDKCAPAPNATCVSMKCVFNQA